MKKQKRDLITKDRIKDFLSSRFLTEVFPLEISMEDFVSQLNDKELKYIRDELKYTAIHYRKSYDKIEVIESVLGAGGVTTTCIGVSALSLPVILLSFPFLSVFMGVGIFYANDYKNKRQSLYNLRIKKTMIDNQIINIIEKEVNKL